MTPLLFVLFGLLAGGVLVVLARDRDRARDHIAARARAAGMVSAGVILLLVVLVFSGVFTGPTAQLVVTTVFLIVAVLMFVAVWVAYRSGAQQDT